MTIKDIRPGLRAYLLSDDTISDLVGGERVFHGQMPQGVTRTSIVFNEISDVGDYHMEGPSGLARPRYQIDVWAADADQAGALALAVKERLDGYRGPFTWGDSSPTESVTVQGVFLAGSRDSYDPASKLFGKSRDYIIWFEER